MRFDRPSMTAASGTVRRSLGGCSRSGISDRDRAAPGRGRFADSVTAPSGCNDPRARTSLLTVACRGTRELGSGACSPARTATGREQFLNLFTPGRAGCPALRARPARRPRRIRPQWAVAHQAAHLSRPSSHAAIGSGPGTVESTPPGASLAVTSTLWRRFRSTISVKISPRRSR